MLYQVPEGTLVTIRREKGWSSIRISKDMTFEKRHVLSQLDDVIHFKHGLDDYYVVNQEVKRISG